jgi:hypothetical protein
MRLRATTTIVLLILLICGCIADQRSGQCFHPQSLCFHNESASDSLSRLTNPALGADPPFPPPPPPPNFDGNDAIWDKAVCRGRNILKAMLLDEEDSSEMLKWPYTQSPWDGELVAELAEWGYSERKYTDSECDFSNHYFFGKALEELNIDPKPADLGGPTQCFHLRHYNGPTVERDQDGDLPPIREQTYKVNQKTYRVSSIYIHFWSSVTDACLQSTGAFSRMGVNGRDGIIYFIHRMSPESAQQSWSKDDLPKLRSTSDLAWGLWNRVAKPDNLKNIRYFVSTNVVNPDTAYDIVPRALREKGVQSGHAQQWPGTAFKFGDDGEADLESSLALLGEFPLP